MLNVNYEHFGYFDNQTFEQVLNDEQSLEFLVARAREEVGAAFDRLSHSMQTLVELNDFEEQSPFAETQRATIRVQMDQLAHESMKLGFLLARADML